MKRSPFKLLVYLFLAGFIIFLFGKYTPLGRISVIPRFAGDSLAYFFIKSNTFRDVAENIRNWKELAVRNEELEVANRELLSQLAKEDTLERENLFLKEALDIKSKMDRDIVYAHIYNINLGPDGYNVLLNKGAEDGVEKGDIVVTGQKELVGIIKDVSGDFSRVLFLLDPEFKITARVLGFNTSGIARGANSDGMYLDLIAKEDEIKENDVLISTGDDTFPSALIIGRIIYVETNESQMFKKVRVDPAVAGQRLGSVIVLKSK